MEVEKFTNFHYVVYWNLFAEVNQDLFAVLTRELDGSVFNESTRSALSGDRQRNESITTYFWKRSKHLVSRTKKGCHGVEEICSFDGTSCRCQKASCSSADVCNAEKLHELTQPQSLLRQQQRMNIGQRW